MRLGADRLSGARGGRTLFSGVSFALVEGEALVVTGANGAGKSTLLRILVGLLPPSSGQVVFDATEEHPTPGSASHWLGHRDAMKPALSVAENLGFWRDFLGQRDATVEQALDRVGLPGTGHLPYGCLSAGQRRRVATARLLVSRRPIWLLDEPTAALDAASETRFAGLMRDHLAEGGMIVAATHQPLGLDGSRSLVLGRA